MNSPEIGHGSFTIERVYDADPADIFTAWADLNVKARWFTGPENWALIRRELDFRVGGEELLHGKFNGKLETIFKARFHEIAPNERIVYAYDMYVDGILHSVSLATVEIIAAGSGTRLVFTEQIAYLDGTDGREGAAGRKRGWSDHLDRLERQFQRVA